MKLIIIITIVAKIKITKVSVKIFDLKSLHWLASLLLFDLDNPSQLRFEILQWNAMDPFMRVRFLLANILVEALKFRPLLFEFFVAKKDTFCIIWINESDDCFLWLLLVWHAKSMTGLYAT